MALSGLPAAVVDHERPWLAGLQLMFAQMAKLHFGRRQMAWIRVLADMAANDHKQMRYLETIAEQFALLAPDDRKLELQEFESGLKDLRDVGGETRADGEGLEHGRPGQSWTS